MPKDAYYFPHDCNSIQDPKMMTLFYECGLMGVAMFWIIIEILHQQDLGKITEDEFRRYLNFYYKIDQHQGTNCLEKIEQVLNTSGLLVKQNGLIWSERVLKNKQMRQELSQKRSFAGKKSAESRIKSTHVEHLSTHVEQGKERKRKEKKESSSFSPPLFEEITTYCIERKNSVDSKKFIDFYQSKDWMIGKNKMKDWKAAVRTWENRELNTKTKDKWNDLN